MSLYRPTPDSSLPPSIETLTKEQLPAVIVQELKPVTLSKTEIDIHAKKIVALVQSGEADALDMSTKLNYIIEVCKQAKENIREYAVADGRKWGDDEIKVNGAKVEVVQTGTKYDYSGCNDEHWNICSAQLDAVNQRKEEREKFLKNVKKSFTQLNEETGEVRTINPPVKSFTPGIKITFPK